LAKRIEYFSKIQLLLLAILIFFSIFIGTIFARGYGSGDGNGQNYSDYVPMEKIRIFESYDINRDGYLIFEELITMKITNSLFNQMDLDDNGRLSRNEFAKMLDVI
tara:strand:+ start:3877 stop:4194 length:318 start_codon:yes stop_codon:yes gene_type:complete